MSAAHHVGRAGTLIALAATVLVLAPRAQAQEATNTPAATQPSVGKWYLREKIQYVQLGDDPSPEQRDIDEVVATTSLSYGLTRDLAVTLELPLVYSSEESPVSGDDRDFGFGDASVYLKWRPFQWDLSPVDSVRVAFFGGVETPTGSGDLGSHSFDPYAGAVVTAILGRHGLNQSVQYKFNTGGDDFNTRAGDGPDDALRYDTAYLFRLSPAEYTAESSAATYLTFELNGLYETNGDNEIIIGPGVLYEARTFALEASVGFPVVQDVDERPETELVLTFGFRILF